MYLELLISLRQERQKKLISGVCDKGAQTEEKSPRGVKLLTTCKIRTNSQCHGITMRRQIHMQFNTV